MGVSRDALSLRNVGSLLPAIKDLVHDENVTEIMIITHPSRGVLIYFEERGELHRCQAKNVQLRQVESLVRSIAGPLGSDPAKEAMIDGRLADGSRVAMAVPPASPNGPVITIRRFSRVKLSGADLVAAGALPQVVFDGVVRTLCRGGNVLVAGGTGSGKTTLLNAFIGEFPEDDRFVVIEDTVELKVDHFNTVRLEARALPKGATPRDMVKHALRQRPDHIVLGEVRGAEAYDVLQALNTGHGGSMTTIHANSAADSLLRLASCARQGADGMPWDVIAANVAMAFDLIVYQERRPDRSRGVAEVLEVGDYDRVKGVWEMRRRWAAESVLEREREAQADADAAAALISGASELPASRIGPRPISAVPVGGDSASPPGEAESAVSVTVETVDRRRPGKSGLSGASDQSAAAALEAPPVDFEDPVLDRAVARGLG